MKQFILTLAFALFGVMPVFADAPKETTKVCVDVTGKDGQPQKDAKGNVKQNCKVMKVHKKLEGTVVPEKK